MSNNEDAALEQQIATLQKNFNNYKKAVRDEYAAVTRTITAYNTKLRQFSKLQKNPPSLAAIEQQIQRNVTRYENSKNTNRTNALLQEYLPKKTLFTKRKNRIATAIPLKAQANFAKLKQEFDTWEESVKQQRQDLLSNLQKDHVNYNTKKQRKSKLENALVQIERRGNHPLELAIGAKRKELESSKQKKQTKIRNAYIDKFKQYGYDYVPENPGRMIKTGMQQFERVDASPEHFIYVTSKEVRENTPVPEGWAKQENTFTEKGSGQYGNYSNYTYSKYYLTRPIPPGYREGMIPRNQWDAVLAELEQIPQ